MGTIELLLGMNITLLNNSRKVWISIAT